MTKEQLIALGLTEEQATSVAAASAAELTGFSPKADMEAADTARNALQTQLDNVEKLVKGLVKDAKGSTLEEQVTAFQQGIETDRTAAQHQLETIRFDHAVDNALNAAKARNAKAIRALLKPENLKLNADGSVTGLEEQIKALRESDAYLFADGDAGIGTGSDGYFPRRDHHGEPESTGKRLAEAQNATAVSTENPYFK